MTPAAPGPCLGPLATTDSKIPATRHRAQARVLPAVYRVRMTSEARKWARPDLDWRPSGYQPDAPTRLSYGPARRRKTTNRLKHSFEVRLRTPGHPLIPYRAVTSPRRPRIVTP